MPGVTHVVTNVKLVIVHNSPFTLPRKETAAGEGGNSFQCAHDFASSRVSNNPTTQTNQDARSSIDKADQLGWFSIDGLPLW